VADGAALAVEQLLPVPSTVDAGGLVGSLRAAQAARRPFDDEVRSLVVHLARDLRRPEVIRRFPQLGALAYWMRAGEIERLLAAWRSVEVDGIVLVPRGVAFHVPPANVDTVAAHSWLLAAIAGNANVVRIATERSEATSVLLEAIGSALEAHPGIAATTSFVTYGHEADISAALSAADVRIVWGGDDTVEALRRIPRPPRSVEVSFPDRTSLALLDAAIVASLDDAGLDDLAHRLANDVLWFDQLACASPRLVVWVGDADAAGVARGRLYPALRATAEGRGALASTSSRIAKFVHVADVAASGAVRTLDWRSPSVTVAELAEPLFPRDGPGGGLLYDAVIGHVDELAPLVDGRDQTLSYFGVDVGQLRSLVSLLNGRGIDRIVPVGDALRFDRVWDGVDLLQSFAKRVTISVVEGGPS
jgi:hypothetical protein